MYNILYIDDEMDLLHIGKVFLEKTGEFSVVTQPSVREAIQSPLLLTYDAIISDYQMPELNGIEFLKIVRKQSEDIPFILFTGRGREDVVIDAINFGADFYLQKGGDPVAQFAELAHKILQAIERRRAKSELNNAFHKIAASEEELKKQYAILEQTEQKIRESERKYRELSELLPQIVFEVDQNFLITFVNNRACTTLGITPEAIEQGFSILSVIDPAMHGKAIKMFTKSIHHLHTDTEELLFFHGDKSPFPVQMYTDPIYDGNIFKGARGIAIDISEQKKREERLNLLAGLLDFSPASVTVHDTEGNFLYANASTFKLHGYTEEEFYQKNLHDLDSPETERHLNERIRATVEEKEELTFEAGHLCKDGSTLTLLINAKSVDWEGKPVILSVATDISDKKKREEEIFFTNLILKAQNEISPDAILVVDAHDKIISYNQKFKTLTNTPENILEEKNDEILLRYAAESQLEPEKFVLRVQQLNKNVKEKTFDEVTLKDGRIIEQYSAPLVGDDQKFYGRAWFLRDISGRKKIEDELQLLKISVDQSADEVFWLDHTGKILYANDSASKTTGYSPDELKEMNISELDPDMSPDRWNQSMNALRKNKTNCITSRHQRKDGTIIPVEIVAVYVRKGDTEYSFAFVREIGRGS